MVSIAASAGPALPKATPFTKAELLNNERDVLGLYLSGHPLAKYSRHLKKLAKNTISEIQDNPTQGRVQVAGIITRIKKRQTKNKDNWAQLTVEDERQSITANVFSRVWAELSKTIEINQAVIVNGDLRGDELSTKPEITVNSVEPILNAIERKANKVTIHLPENISKDTLMRLHSIFDASKGICEVYLTINVNGKETVISIPKHIRINQALVNFIEENFGKDAWDFE